MPQYEVYEVESGRVVSTTDSLDEVANPLPEGLDVRDVSAETERDESDGPEKPAETPADPT